MKNKKLKLCSSSSQKEKGSIEDRLISLPEPIRNHILSFLPIEDTIKLSLLSTQWKDICSSLSTLKFEQYKFQQKTKGKEIDFRNLVDRMIFNHDTCNITNFKLVVILDRNVITNAQVSLWVSFVLKHNVQEFFFGLSWRKLGKLPCSLFTCHTLTKLSLVNMELRLPTVIYFPNLKILKFCDVKFPDQRFTENLLPRCPALEYLCVIACRFYFLKTFNISAPNLKKLQFWCNPIVKLEINVSAPNLEVIKYNPSRKVVFNELNLSPETLHSMTTVVIHMHGLVCPMGMVTKILMGLSNVTRLCLRGTTIELLDMMKDLSACPPISCYSLTHLEVEMWPSKDHVKLLVLLLRSFPNLLTLLISFKIKEGSTDIFNIKGYQQSQELFTSYFLAHLKTIDINHFGLSSEYELHIVRYLLENCNILEKMEIKYIDSIKKSLLIRLGISDMLLTFICLINFHCIKGVVLFLSITFVMVLVKIETRVEYELSL